MTPEQSAEGALPARSRQLGALKHKPGIVYFKGNDKPANSRPKSWITRICEGFTYVVTFQWATALWNATPAKAKPKSWMTRIREGFTYVVTFQWATALWNYLTGKTKMKMDLEECQQRNKKLTDLINLLPDTVREKLPFFKSERKAVVDALKAELSVNTQASHTPATDATLSDPLLGLKEMKGTARALRTKDNVSVLNLDGLNQKIVRGEKLTQKIPGRILHPQVCPYAPLSAYTGAELSDKLDKRVSAELFDSYPLPWGCLKGARDIWQNFADGHGGTLAGVDLKVEKQADGSYQIEIAGQAEYSHEMLEGLGATSKATSETSTGNFGEGAKAVALKGLTDGWMDSIVYESRDWQTRFTLKAGTLVGKPIQRLFRHLKKVPDKPGNRLMMTSKDPAFVKALIQAINYFPHDGNPDFHKVTFENENFGFTFFGNEKNKKGNLYLVNQRNEFGSRGGWDNQMPDLTLWTKRKTKQNDEKDRDRTYATSQDLKSALEHPTMVPQLKDQEVIDLIETLKPLWKQPQDYADHNSPARMVLKTLLAEASKRDLGIRFDPKYLAASCMISNGVADDLARKGKILCDEAFSRIGMVKADDYYRVVNSKKGLPPTPQDVQRINILKRTARLLLEGIPQEGLIRMKPEDMKQRIANHPLYLFESSADKIDEGTMAMDGQTCIWFQQSYLRTSGFDSIVSTYLHELTHQYGGDDSATFSYAMTDWVTYLNRAYSQDRFKWQELQDLRLAWESLGNTAQKPEAAPALHKVA